MKHVTYADSDTYPIGLLIKESAFNSREIHSTYVSPLNDAGITSDDVIAVTLEYGPNNKVTASGMKEYLAQLLVALDSVGTRFLYCADSQYFKTLTGQRKAEPHMGYILPCKMSGFQHMKVILGVNHKSLLYNPNNEPRLTMSIDTLIGAVNGTHKDLGDDIIHSASYPGTLEQIKIELQELHQHRSLSCDIEAASLDFDKAGIGTITFTWSLHDGMAFNVDYTPLPNGPVDNVYAHMQKNEPVRQLLREFFESYKGNIRWHGSTYDLKVLIFELWMKDALDTDGLLKGLEIMTRDFDDTKIIAYLATNSTAGNNLSLKDLAHEFAGNWAVEEIKDITRVEPAKLLEYNLIDGLSTNFVYDKYYSKMVSDKQLMLYRDLMLPSLKTIIQMELTGMPLSPPHVRKARVELEDIVSQAITVLHAHTAVQAVTTTIQTEAMNAANAKLKTKQHPIEHFADKQFNPNSGAHVQKLLYEELGLPVIDRTDSGQPAVGHQTLDKVRHHVSDPSELDLIDALIDYGKANKVLTSFIPAFERAIDKGDGVIWLHGNFNLGGTVSGRLSSSDPNMQNIPSGSKFGKLIKACFRAPEGWLFCGADFNSLEDYISALTTRDPNKLKVYTDGYDGHSLRAYSYFPLELPDIYQAEDTDTCYRITVGEQTFYAKAGDTVQFADGSCRSVEEL